MVFVFFMFIFIPKCLPSSFTLLANIWSSLSLSAVIPVSSAYLRLLILLPPIDTPSSSFSITRKISSVKRLKRYGDSTHPCLVPLLILIPSEFPFSVRTTATCSQYSLAIILMSFPSNPASFNISINLSWFTRSNAFS